MSHFGLWCKDCDDTMPYFDMPHCPICAQLTAQGEICGSCLKNPPLFSRTIAAFSYQFPLDQLIQSLKYHEQLVLAHRFAEKLGQRIRILPDLIIPMPLHPEKLKSRGFNQAQLIAEPIAKSLNIPLLSRACHRLRDTPTQTSLPWKDRNKNVQGAFSCEMNLSGKHVALVDDVFTTGASLNALAGAIQKQGASEISAWVVARTIQD
jgi:ComF family protein